MNRETPLLVTVALVAVAAGAVVAGFPDAPAARLEQTPTLPTFADPGVDVPTTLATTTTIAPPDSTTTSTEVTTTAAELTARSAITVIVANATGVESVAGVFRDRIKPLGYSKVFATLAKDLARGITIYGMVGFEDEALRLATEIGLGADRVVIVGSRGEAPSYSLDLDFDLLVIVGSRT